MYKCWNPLLWKKLKIFSILYYVTEKTIKIISNGNKVSAEKLVLEDAFDAFIGRYTVRVYIFEHTILNNNKLSHFTQKNFQIIINKKSYIFLN